MRLITPLWVKIKTEMPSMRLFLKKVEMSQFLQQSAVVNEQEARSITLQDKPDVEVLEARLGLLNGGTCMGSQLSYE